MKGFFHHSVTQLDKKKKCSVCYQRASALEGTLYSIIPPMDETQKIIEEEEKQEDEEVSVREESKSKRSQIVKCGDRKSSDGKTWTIIDKQHKEEKTKERRKKEGEKMKEGNWTTQHA